MFFEVLGLLERYHPRRQLRMQLARIMVLNLLNLYALIFALFDKISSMSDTSLCKKKNITETRKAILRGLYSLGGSKHEENTSDGYIMSTSDYFSSESYFISTTSDYTTTVVENTTRCFEVVVSCKTPTTLSQTLITSMFLLNLTTTMPPEYTTNNGIINGSTFPSYDDDFNSFNDAYDPFDDNSTVYSATDGTINSTAFDTNSTRRFKREYDDDNYDQDDDYEHDYDNEGTDKMANFYNQIAHLFANFNDGTNSPTNLNGNASDIYATISTIIDNITSTSSTWSDEKTTDYARKCWLNVGIIFSFVFFVREFLFFCCYK